MKISKKLASVTMFGAGLLGAVAVSPVINSEMHTVVHAESGLTIGTVKNTESNPYSEVDKSTASVNGTVTIDNPQGARIWRHINTKNPESYPVRMKKDEKVKVYFKTHALDLDWYYIGNNKFIIAKYVQPDKSVPYNDLNTVLNSNHKVDNQTTKKPVRKAENKAKTTVTTVTSGQNTGNIVNKTQKNTAKKPAKVTENKKNVTKPTISNSVKNTVKKNTTTPNTEYHNSIKITYNLNQLQEAVKKPSILNNQSAKGMKINQFHSEKKSDNRMVDVNNLSVNSQKELSLYALNLINDVRKQEGLPAWTYSAKVQELGVKIAQNYTRDKMTILSPDHDVKGIVDASRSMGLNINKNYVENEGGFYSKSTIVSMDTVKKQIYWNLKQMFFGGALRENGPYTEYDHANSLLKPQASHFALSFSQANSGSRKIISTHYIDVSTSAIAYSNYYGGSFRV